MKIVVKGKTYDKLKDLSFTPEVDITGGSVPVSQFQADAITSDAMPYGELCRLYDDNGKLWAKYWIIYAERVDAQVYRVRAQSQLMLLDRLTMHAVYYNDLPATTVLNDIMRRPGITNINYTADEAIINMRVTGFCPEQTGRERLAAVLYVLGAYARDYFSDVVEILPVRDEMSFIPQNRTFLKPTVTYRDWVTEVVATAYTYEAREPSEGEEYDTDADGDTFVRTATEVRLQNPNVPADAPVNVVTLTDLKLVNLDNVSGVLERMGAYYFDRIELELDCINNGLYMPGERVLAFADEGMLFEGIIEQCSFEFGLQARSKVKIYPALAQRSAKLTIRYKFGDALLGRQELTFPVDYQYTVQTAHFDRMAGGRRRIYRPTVDAVTGTMQAGGVTVDVPCEVALEAYMGTLDVYAVDAIKYESNGVELE